MTCWLVNGHSLFSMRSAAFPYCSLVQWPPETWRIFMSVFSFGHRIWASEWQCFRLIQQLHLMLGTCACNQRQWAKLIDLYQAGLVTATISGSPCETFSAARHHVPEVEPGKQWPRPLRSAERLLWLPALTMKELRQLSLGSEFALQTILAGVWALATGAIWVIPGSPNRKITRVFKAISLEQVPEAHLCSIGTTETFPNYQSTWFTYPMGSMYAIYGNIYHQYPPNVSIYTIHGSYGHMIVSEYGIMSLLAATWNVWSNTWAMVQCCSAKHLRTQHVAPRQAGERQVQRDRLGQGSIFFKSLWIQPYLLKKCDWGMMTGGLAVPSQEVFGSIGNKSISHHLPLFW